MKTSFSKKITAILFAAGTFSIQAQDTFSIVAADSTTREVGSAGASCVDLFTTSFTDHFLGDLLPNKGAINTQAAYITQNQTNARTRMNAGDTPAQIITWLQNNDAQGNSTTRQYGIVGFTGNNVSAAGFTGVNCQNYKNHKTGKINGIYYSIQGNILLGQKVIDSMESRFRRAPGDMACRLMAALQGANMVGADTRCASNNTSTLFAFVKVSKSTDPYNSPSFLVSVRTRNGAKIEPIDTLQKKFNLVKSCTATGISSAPVVEEGFTVYPNPANDRITVDLYTRPAGTPFTISDATGKEVIQGVLNEKTTEINIQQLGNGIYLFRLGNSAKQTFKVMKN